jgi:DNA ligase-1
MSWKQLQFNFMNEYKKQGEIMLVSEILSEIKQTSGSNAKKAILETHNENTLLKTALQMGLNPFTPFHVVKVPKVADDDRDAVLPEANRWVSFFQAAQLCANREYTGNAAIEIIHNTLSCATKEEEKWMRKILKKHLAIGASTKTINKVFPGLIPTFDVALAQKFEEKRIKGMTRVGIDPKLDGIRCFAIVEDEKALLYARSGKLITNFDDTIGKELIRLGPGCYDGEIMGKDFIDLMRQAYRKENVDVSDAYLALFDFLPLEEWKSRVGVMTCQDRYAILCERLRAGGKLSYLRRVPRYIVAAEYDAIKGMHDEFAAQGYEGAMVKDLDAPYKFGRGPEVMKLKAFHDVDLKIERLIEGTGKHSGKLGSVVVNYHGVDVQVGSGFSDELRDTIWETPDMFINRMIEVRYQEVTPDGSLRFPTFVCFRNDRT